MSGQPTPETDAQVADVDRYKLPLTLVRAEFARKLERERNEAGNTIEKLELDLEAMTHERDELAEWKRQQMVAASKWDVQAVGKLLGLPLGATICPAIEPSIRVMIDALSKIAHPDVIQRGTLNSKAIAIAALARVKGGGK